MRRKHTPNEPSTRRRRLKLAVLVLVVPLSLDVLISGYDLLTDPSTRTHGVIAPLQPVRDRSVAWELNDSRRISNLQFRLAGRRLQDKDLSVLRDGIRGWIDLAPEDPKDAGTPLQGYEFLVEMQSPVALPRIERSVVPGEDRDAPGSALARSVRYDVSCLLRPADGQREKATALRRREFPAKQPITVHVTLLGDVPEGLFLMASYSRRPRSLLHGTPLAGVSAWLGRR